jgi:hypothetical protein
MDVCDREAMIPAADGADMMGQSARLDVKVIKDLDGY